MVEIQEMFHHTNSVWTAIYIAVNAAAVDCIGMQVYKQIEIPMELLAWITMRLERMTVKILSRVLTQC